MFRSTAFLANRRRFFHWIGAGVTGVLVAACGGAPPAAPTSAPAAGAAPASTPPTPTSATAAPSKSASTAAPTTAPKPAPGGIFGGGGSQLPVNVPRNQVFVLGQIFRYSVVNNFNLFVPGGPPSPTRQGLVFDTLWYIDQETGKWINSLATDKPTYNADFTQMTVKLRPGVMWSDGKEFSADDLLYTVNTLKATKGLSWNAELNLYLDSAKQTDTGIVVFTLKQPNPRFHMYFTANYNAIYMMAKHIWEKAGDIKTFTNFPPVSLGAYVYAQSDPNGFWELFKRRDDWQKTTPGMIVGKSGPDYIMTQFQGSDTKDVIAVGRHDEDGFMDVNFEAFKSLLESTPSARSWYKSFPWAYPNELNVRFFGFNQAKPPYDNKDVRWALALALDIVGLQTLYEGGVTRVTPIPIPATTAAMKLYHIPLESWLKELSIDDGSGGKFQPYDPDVPKRIADWATKQGYKVPTDAEGLRLFFGTGWWKHAPDVAAKLLTKSGFKKDAQGKWQTPDGKPWTISIIAAPDEVDAYRLALGAQDQWKKFGIDVQVQGLERTPFSNLQNTGDFVCTSSWTSLMGAAQADLWPRLNSYHSQFFTPVGQSTASHGSSNIVRFKDPELDKITDAMAKLSPDDPKVVELGQSAVKTWVENMLTLTTVSFKKFITVDGTYWKGWPTSENPWSSPEYWFMHARFTLQGLESTKA